MKILVTGGAGFIGSHIVDHLIARGDQVVVIDNLSTGKENQVHQSAQFYQVDLTDGQKLQTIFNKEKPEVLIHQAAQTSVQISVEQPAFDATTNIIGTVNLLEACRLSGVKKVVFASSAAVYGDPTYVPIDEAHPVQPLSGYGIGKYTAEQYLYAYKNLYGLEYTVLRYANVYGIRQDPRGEGGVISIFIDKVIQGQQMTIFGDGEQTRDYVYVDDIARANLAAISAGDGEFINIGTGVKTSLNELVDLLAKIAGKKVTKQYLEERSGDIRHSSFICGKSKQVLGWEPQVPLREGLTKTYQYYFPSILEKTL